MNELKVSLKLSLPGDMISGRSATPVRHKWHLRLSLNGPRGDGGDGFERHRKEEEGREEGGRGG